jgi:hypothetical protein
LPEEPTCTAPARDVDYQPYSHLGERQGLVDALLIQRFDRPREVCDLTSP